MKQKPSAINSIWLGLVLLATLTAAYTGRMDEVTMASFDAAKAGVMLAIGLIGAMAFWLGIMKVAEAGGLMRALARAVRPLMIRLFPDVPADHPAMSAMIMNMAANALGLGNAATPMGIKAMQELEKLAPEKGTATNAMCLFLAINTSSVTLLPLGVITVRAAAGATSPAAILLPSLAATLCSTCVAIFMAKILAARGEAVLVKGPSPTQAGGEEPKEAPAPATRDLHPPGPVGRWLVWLLITAFVGGIAYQVIQNPPSSLLGAANLNVLSSWLIPMLISGLLIYGYLRGVQVYEVLTEGAKEGFTTAVRIIPFLVAIFVAVGMFRASGAMDLLITFFTPLTSLINMPAESLAMAFMRPLSGSGAFGIMSEIVSKDPDSFLSFLVSTMQGSTETTFYVLAIYFGSIGIKRSRHALPAALCADAAGVLAAVAVCNLWF
ncbi:MAG: nucleoside recognition domain-containing protein [Desulfurivibrionaceae bacterium]|nr:nucleoside recognition domain-containing protein [Desulfurivibrionaceae bacterium]